MLNKERSLYLYVSRRQMRGWQRVPFALLALLAMFATLLPQTLWACPMTGRLDTAARVCLGVMPSSNGAMPCAHMGGKCCKPISVPPLQDDGSSHQAVAVPLLGHAIEPFTFAYFPFDTTPFIAPSCEQTQAPLERIYLARFTNSPPPHLSRYRPAALAGRAPPLL